MALTKVPDSLLVSGGGGGGTSPLRDTARNLVITRLGSPAVDLTITADELILQTDDGTSFRATSVNETPSITTSGAGGLDTGSEAANTWYYIWIIYNDTVVDALFSTSSTAPTMPSGYTYKALVGAVRNDASSNFIDFEQQDNIVILPALQTVITGSMTVDAWTAQSVTSFYPATAKKIRGIITSASSLTGIAPYSDGNGGEANRFANPTTAKDMAGLVPIVRDSFVTFNISYKSTVYYHVASASSDIYAIGWEY